MPTHLDHASLGSFVGGEMRPREKQSVLAHLLAGCRQCSSLVNAHSRLDTAIEHDEGPEEAVAIGRIMGVVRQREYQLAAERDDAPALLAELRPHPQPRRLTMVRNSRRFHRWGFCELVAKQCFEEVFSEPSEAVRLGEIAVAAADALDGREYGKTLVEDMRGRTLGYLANARRVMSDFRGSREAFQAAQLHLERGTGDPIERGDLLFFEATLCWAERRLSAAHRLLDRAIALYERAGDGHLVGRAMLQRSAVFERAGEAERAVTVIREALPLLDRERDPRLVQIARSSLIYCLNECGQHDEALALLEEARAGYSGSRDRILLLRLTWTEGRIELARDRLREAEAAFTAVRSAFIEEGIPIEVALVSMDLAMVYIRLGRTAEIKRLAVEMLTIFRSLHIQREMIAALMFFQKAVEMETVTVRLITELAAYLERSRRNPELKFEFQTNP
jgi:tetratricopeptide (TPR) repeat protein